MRERVGDSARGWEWESENLYGQLKSPLLFIWKFAVVYVRYPSNFRQRLRIHDSQWPLVSVQDWLQLGQSLVRIAANLICSIYLLSHLSFMPKTLCPIIELYIYKLVKNLSKMDSFRLCKLSTHCPQVIRTSETWGKPQTLKKIITQVRALALNFKSKNISEMDPSLPVLDFVGSVHIAPKSLGPVRHGANLKLWKNHNSSSTSGQKIFLEWIVDYLF